MRRSGRLAVFLRPVMHPTLFQIIGTSLFGLAILHTFSVKFFSRLAHIQPRHAGIWHLLSEVEVVFGFWALVLILFMSALEGNRTALVYLESRNFTEPLFVFAIMVIAGTKPILQLVDECTRRAAALIPLNQALALHFLVLTLVPLLGSFITEPAAMTIAALMLKDTLSRQLTDQLKYATVGVLFVNISIGGTLTPFAAPPVLMVSAQWGWDVGFMLSHFGYKAALAVCINALLVTLIFRKELQCKVANVLPKDTEPMPLALTLVHVVFLVLVVVSAHHPVVFIGLFLFFLGISSAYSRHQSPLILREALLVAFFLAGLVVLGGVQQWWLEPVLLGMGANTIFFAATGLTAITDNAALTYLASQVTGLSLEFKTALVAGAVAGGGLTLIANAPNPAGAAILKNNFLGNTISPWGLLLGALPPTVVAMVAFKVLP